MIPILFDSNEKDFYHMGLGALTDAVTCTVKQELDGEFTLTMTYPITGSLFDKIALRQIIYAKVTPYDNPQPFRIYEISRPIKGIVTIDANHISYDLSGYPLIKIEETEEVDIDGAIDIFKTNMLGDCPFEFYVDSNVDRSIKKIIKMDRPCSIKSVFGSRIAEKDEWHSQTNYFSTFTESYGVDVLYDGFEVWFVSSVGSDNGTVISYGHNMKDITYQENSDTLYTDVYPYFVESSGGSTDIIEVEGTEPQASTGSKIVEVEGKLINVISGADYTRILPLDLSSEFKDEEGNVESPDPAALREKALEYIAANGIGRPKVNINVSFKNSRGTVSDIELSNLQKARLGDIIHVWYPMMKLNVKSVCISTAYDVLSDEYTNLELGDQKSTIAKTIIKASDKDFPKTNHKVAQVFLYSRIKNRVDFDDVLTYSFTTNGFANLKENFEWSDTQEKADEKGGGGNLFMISAIAQSDSNTDNIYPNEWSDPIDLSGTDTYNTAPIFIYRHWEDAMTVPAAPSVDAVYDFQNGTLTFDGETEWTTVPVVTGIGSTYISQAVALSTNNTDTISSSEWSQPRIFEFVVEIEFIKYIISDYGDKDHEPSDNEDWETDYPTLSQGKWLWIWTKYNDGTSSKISQYCAVDGKPGEPGEPGKDAVDILYSDTIYYCTRYSKPSAPSDVVNTDGDLKEMWTLTVPTYSDGYAYYRCLQNHRSDGTITFGIVSRDYMTEESAKTYQKSVANVQIVYYKTLSEDIPAAPTSWVNTSSDVYDEWTTIIPSISSDTYDANGDRIPTYYYTCTVIQNGLNSVSAGRVSVMRAEHAISAGLIVSNHTIVYDQGTNDILFEADGSVGKHTVKIAGFDVSKDSLKHNVVSIGDTEHDGVYVGTDGIQLGKNKFRVDNTGHVSILVDGDEHTRAFEIHRDNGYYVRIGDGSVLISRSQTPSSLYEKGYVRLTTNGLSLEGLDIGTETVGDTDTITIPNTKLRKSLFLTSEMYGSGFPAEAEEGQLFFLTN